MNQSREYGLDLMRVIAAILIVAFHCAPMLFLNAAAPDITAVTVSEIIFTLGKACVNFFFMVSGAFVLASPRTQELKVFYTKMWKRLCIPTIVFALLYFALDIVKTVLSGGVWTDCLQTFFKGESGQHMWYMFVLIGLYLAAPLVQHLKNKVSLRTFTLTATALVILGFLGEATSPHYLDWDPGFIVNNLGIFMLGYCLHEHSRGKRSRPKGALLLLLAAVLGTVHASLILLLSKTEIFILSDLFSIKSQSPVIVLIGALLMTGVMRLDIQKDFSRAGALTYGVYLVHLVFVYIGLYILSAVHHTTLSQYEMSFPEFFLITAAVTVVSFALTALYREVFGKKKITVKENGGN